MMHLMDTRENPPGTDEPRITSERLTGSQLRILKLIDLGFSNREIAAKLGITVGTTKWHVHQLFEKLQVKSRAKASALARERGLV
jgi:LuxR family maltose regulon positive regulatory protein